MLIAGYHVQWPQNRKKLCRRLKRQFGLTTTRANTKRKKTQQQQREMEYQ